jgi:acetyl-CoA carboxylase biotin carboxyl carrier protein
MKLETIEKLIQFMEQHGLTELQVREDDLEFKARRGERPVAPFIFQPAHGIVNAPGGATPVAENGGGAPLPPAGGAPSEAGPAVVTESPSPAAPTAKPGSGLREVCSPIVGTFYRRPSPNAPAYKEVGDRVSKDDVVCIVEAMKVMNEIKGEFDGVIRKILHEDGTPVEYGQPLFFVEPDRA